MAVGPKTVTVKPRAEVLAFLESLGHDPNAVACFKVTPTEISVVYTHPIVDPPKES